MAMESSRAALAAWLATVVLGLGVVMAVLDLTIVNIAIPSIVAGLHASLDQVLWMLNAYSLVYAVLLITAGRLGDILGPRNLFMVGVAVFALGSGLCGHAPDALQLILARAVQGLGAALLSPQLLPIITGMFTPARRGAPLAALGALSGLAMVAGPILGGIIVIHLDWRWIFYVNLPAGAVTLLLTRLLVPDVGAARRTTRLDLLGVLLATTGLFGVVFGLIEGQRYEWGTVWAAVSIPEILGAGVLVLLVFLVVQYRTQNLSSGGDSPPPAARQSPDAQPLLPLRLFRSRELGLMSLVLAAMAFTLVSFLLPLTIYLQSVLGLDALDAGLTMIPMAAGITFAAGLSSMLSDRFGGGQVVLLGLLTLTAGLLLVALTMQPDAGRWSVLPGLVVTGFGSGCVWAPAYALAMRGVASELAGVASGVISTTQELGAVIASAAVGALLQNRLAASLPQRAAEYSAQAPAAFRVQFVDAFRRASKGGLDVGAARLTADGAPAGSASGPVLEQLQQIAHQVFAHAFVDAVRPTLLVPAGVVLLAALVCATVRWRRQRVTATGAGLSSVDLERSKSHRS
jgi:MFS family permease